jgi:hypothetical protein
MWWKEVINEAWSSKRGSLETGEEERGATRLSRTRRKCRPFVATNGPTLT